MISLGTWFWLMIGFFAIIGIGRGWTKEIIATSGLVLSLFALNQFGYLLVSLLGAAADPTSPNYDPMTIRRQQFYILTAVHLFITFFSYEGPTLAGGRLSERLRVRDSLQDKVLGALVGAVNGYLIVGAIWAFLEFNVTATDGWVPLPTNEFYPFDASVITRPVGELVSLVEKLPLPALSPYLPFLVVVVFLFVIIVMI
ncbi:MAG: CvpA family protein [Chloroflexi bacterium]|nr:CvpA family protein [Chloroflexota bacterium]